MAFFIFWWKMGVKKYAGERGKARTEFTGVMKIKKESYWY